MANNFIRSNKCADILRKKFKKKVKKKYIFREHFYNLYHTFGKVLFSISLD